MASTAASSGVSRKSAVAALLAILIALLAASMAQAATFPISGTTTLTGGNGFTNSEFTYDSPGILGTGTMVTEFTVFVDATSGLVHVSGTFVLTRMDGATLTGPFTATVGPIYEPQPWPVTGIHVVTAGTGEFAGATGEITISGTIGEPGTTATMSGTLNIPRPVPTDKDQCKDGGWRNLDDDHGRAFRNQGRCVAFVQAGA